MAIYKPEVIQHKCTKLWHNCMYQKIGELTNPGKDGNWHIDASKYDYLVDEADCNKCTQEKLEAKIKKGERDAVNAWRLANGLEERAHGY